MNSMSKINVQYSNNLLLRHYFKCKNCGIPLLMFGCPNKNCKEKTNNEVRLNNVRKTI